MMESDGEESEDSDSDDDDDPLAAITKVAA
jgi:hypothetical protein